MKDFSDVNREMGNVVILEAIELLEHHQGIYVDKPNLDTSAHYSDTNPFTKTEVFSFAHHAGVPGSIRISPKFEHTRPWMLFYIAHELGRAALFQAHPDIYTDIPLEFNEGFAQICGINTCINASTKRNGGKYIYPAMRKIIASQFSPFTRGVGYRQVCKHLTNGTTLRDIVDNPKEFY
ncbi:hypothetical protein GOV11_01870 [Candidatus Woesearchaeota archaeon]|nr:hypothetical protein [Candidatus Woesearchaeota archaeon]